MVSYDQKSLCVDLIFLQDMPQTEAGIQNIVLTRIVSRILLRVGKSFPCTITRLPLLILIRISAAHWRQHHFRPHKALPVESTGHHHLRHYNRSPGFMRRAADVLVSCLMLGVPYLFYTRGYHRGDAEGGTGTRSVLPILLIGACTCLLVSPILPPPCIRVVDSVCKAAVLLSASITFLSLPGLDHIARAVALVVVLLAAGAMASGLVALFRYKSELVDAARPVAVSSLNPRVIGGEGVMVISVGAMFFQWFSTRFFIHLCADAECDHVTAAGPPDLRSDWVCDGCGAVFIPRGGCWRGQV